MLEKSHVALFQKSEVGAGSLQPLPTTAMEWMWEQYREELMLLYIWGHFSVSVCVPPGLAHFVRLIYVGKINKSELRFLSSTVRLEKAFSFDGTFRTRYFWTH